MGPVAWVWHVWAFLYTIIKEIDLKFFFFEERASAAAFYFDEHAPVEMNVNSMLEEGNNF